jgi:hypothetical protein
MSALVHTIDVAHPPRNAEDVESELVEAWSQVRNSAALRLLKVIHGYGSGGKGGTTKEVVRSWAFRNRGKFRMIVEGEQYSLGVPEVQELRNELGNYPDIDLERANPGVILIWVK